MGGIGVLVCFADEHADPAPDGVDTESEITVETGDVDEVLLVRSCLRLLAARDE